MGTMTKTTTTKTTEKKTTTKYLSIVVAFSLVSLLLQMNVLNEYMSISLPSKDPSKDGGVFFETDLDGLDLKTMARADNDDADNDAATNPNPFREGEGEQVKGKSASRSRPRSSRPVCHDTKHLFYSESHATDADVDGNIKVAYEELESFHNEGGNLKTIENYLNDHMDSTLDLLDITFTPKGDSGPIPADQSITKTYKETLIKYDKHNRGGYDQRSMPGSYNSNSKHSALRGGMTPRFDVIEPTNEFLRWKKGLGPIINLCQHLDFIKPQGKSKRHGFEEKFMCSLPLQPDAQAQAQNLNNDTNKNTETTYEMKTTSSPSSCEMISIGSNGEWGFEENIAATTSCQTHTFDCTVPNNELHKPDIPSIHFYPTCIGHEYKKIQIQEGEGEKNITRFREYLTYHQTLAKAGLTQPPTLLKMDVEGFEYDVLKQMIVSEHKRQQEQEQNEDGLDGDASGNKKDNAGKDDMLPQQISVELHYASRMYDLPWMPRYRTAAEIALFSGMMYNLGGYVMVHAKYIVGCDSCAEVLFVRVFCD